MRLIETLAPLIALVHFLTLGTPLATRAQQLPEEDLVPRYDAPPEPRSPTSTGDDEAWRSRSLRDPYPDLPPWHPDGDQRLGRDPGVTEIDVGDDGRRLGPTRVDGPFDEPTDDLPQLPTAPPGDDPPVIERPPDGWQETSPPAGKSGATPSVIPVPSGEGSVEGMGESFSPHLSSGTGTFSVPLAVPPGRAGVQPSLALSYSTSAGNSDVGFGWSCAVPFISRQTDRGLPGYVDEPVWHPEEDRFIYNGGQELVPVDTAEVAAVEGVSPTDVPAEVTGWQQYRAQVEGGFMRFFRSPTSDRWIVQSKDGTRFDFGLLPAGEGPSDLDDTKALQTENDDGTGPVFRWLLTRMSDAHGSTVYYRYVVDQGRRYLDDVHYVSPASCGGVSSTVDDRRGCTEPLSNYGVRVDFDYEGRDDVFTVYTPTWAVATGKRLARVAVTAAEGSVGTRYLVRRYHLTYNPSSFHSLLEEVRVEGRPDTADPTTGVRSHDPTADAVAEASLGAAIVGALLPPMRFSYTTQPSPAGSIAGFGGIEGASHPVGSSPPHSVDDARSDFFDVNADGLPDLIVTDPARYRTAGGAPAVGVFFNGFDGGGADPAYAGTFSGAVPVPMDPGRSGSLNLGNLNVVPMDIDGDGRSDLLHMPRRADYGYFTPTREADDAIAEVSPAKQGWRFTHVGVSLPRGVLDPRIDLARDAPTIKAFDVNNDHLVDVVRRRAPSCRPGSTWAGSRAGTVGSGRRPTTVPAGC